MHKAMHEDVRLVVMVCCRSLLFAAICRSGAFDEQVECQSA